MSQANLEMAFDQAVKLAKTYEKLDNSILIKKQMVEMFKNSALYYATLLGWV